MIPHRFYSPLLVLGLLWLFILWSLAWPSSSGPQAPRPVTPSPSRHKRCKETKPLAGLTHKPPAPCVIPTPRLPAHRLRGHPPLGPRPPDGPAPSPPPSPSVANAAGPSEA